MIKSIKKRSGSPVSLTFRIHRDEDTRYRNNNRREKKTLQIDGSFFFSIVHWFCTIFIWKKEEKHAFKIFTVVSMVFFSSLITNLTIIITMTLTMIRARPGNIMNKHLNKWAKYKKVTRILQSHHRERGRLEKTHYDDRD